MLFRFSVVTAGLCLLVAVLAIGTANGIDVELANGIQAGRSLVNAFRSRAARERRDAEAEGVRAPPAWTTLYEDNAVPPVPTFIGHPNVQIPAAPNAKAQAVVDAVFGSLAADYNPFDIEADGLSLKDQKALYRRWQKGLFRAGLRLKAASNGMDIPAMPDELPILRTDFEAVIPKMPAGTGNRVQRWVETNNIVIGIAAVRCFNKDTPKIFDVSVSASKDLQFDGEGKPGALVANNINFYLFQNPGGAPAPPVSRWNGHNCPAHATVKCGYHVKDERYTATPPGAAPATRPGVPDCGNMAAAMRADPDMNVLRRLFWLRQRVAEAEATHKDTKSFANTVLNNICPNNKQGRVMFKAIYFDERSICQCCQHEMQNNLGGLANFADYMDAATGVAKYGVDAPIKIVMGPLAADRTTAAAPGGEACRVEMGEYPPHVYGKSATGAAC